MRVPQYTDLYLKTMWNVIKGRKARGESINKDQEAEVRAEMLKRGFPL